MMHGVHIGGQRAGAFLELVGGVDPKRVLLVGVDVAKGTWFVVVPNLPGGAWGEGAPPPPPSPSPPPWPTVTSSWCACGTRRRWPRSASSRATGGARPTGW